LELGHPLIPKLQILKLNIERETVLVSVQDSSMS